MNVTLYGTAMAGRVYPSCGVSAAALTAAQARTQTAAASGSYDKLTLHRAQYPADSESFARILTQETGKAASSAAGQERVEELKKQVSEGSYQPDARAIAEKILYYRPNTALYF